MTPVAYVIELQFECNDPLSVKRRNQKIKKVNTDAWDVFLDAKKISQLSQDIPSRSLVTSQAEMLDNRRVVFSEGSRKYLTDRWNLKEFPRCAIAITG